MITSHVPTLDFADSILYLAALLADQPRSIDQYIDYFGAGPSALGIRTGPGDASGHLSALGAAAGIETDRRQRHLTAWECAVMG